MANVFDKKGDLISLLCHMFKSWQFLFFYFFINTFDTRGCLCSPFFLKEMNGVFYCVHEVVKVTWVQLGCQVLRRWECSQCYNSSSYK